MSLLEKLIRQLGSVDIDPNGLVLVVDGRQVEVAESLSIRVAATAPRRVPAPTRPPEIIVTDDNEEDEEWEWQLAMARARAAASSDADEQEDDDAEWARRIAMARAMSLPVPAQPESVPRPRRVPKGTEPPVSIDEDVTTEIEIGPRKKARRALPGMPPALRERTPARPARRRARRAVAAAPAPAPTPRPIPVPPPLPPPPGEGE